MSEYFSIQSKLACIQTGKNVHDISIQYGKRTGTEKKSLKLSLFPSGHGKLLFCVYDLYLDIVCN